MEGRHPNQEAARNKMTEKIILISPKAQAHIHGALTAFGIVKKCPKENTASYILAFIEKQEKNKHRMQLVLILLYDEYKAVKSKIRQSEFLAYSYILFGRGENMKTVAAKADEVSLVSSFNLSMGEPLVGETLDFEINKAFAAAELMQQTILKEKSFAEQFSDTQHDQNDLIKIGLSLSVEKDQQKLLYLILHFSKSITGADAGSIYIIEKDENKNLRLRFKASETFCRNIPLEEFVLPVDKKSIAGYVASTGEVLNIPDVYKINELNLGLSHNASFDEQNNYITKSMLVVPMLNQDKKVIGVIQLINSKKDESKNYFHNEAYSIRLKTKKDFERFVIPFDKKYESLMQAVAGQSAVAVENNRLLIQIQTQFAEFVRASVSAVESLDPTTSGHSFRVAALCVAMAKAINNVNSGYLAKYHFNEDKLRELEFAALLHDFGKIYVDLNILKKHKKLYPKDLENLMMRLDYLYRYVELNGKQEKTGRAKERGEHIDSTLKEIMLIKETISDINEPAVTDKDIGQILSNISQEINSIPCISPDGKMLTILTDDNIANLGIRRGSLNAEERKEIEKHVVYSYNFLNNIPWPPEYQDIAEIALGHHEKLDGSGYPKGIKGRENIMLQSRIMAVADIYDALAAIDRPYKKAIAMSDITRILNEEAAKGALDADVVKLFIDKKIYNVLRKKNKAKDKTAKNKTKSKTIAKK